MRWGMLLLFFGMITVQVFAGKVDTVTITQPGWKQAMKAVVIKPAKADKNHKVPILYLLHGFGGKYSLWLQKVPELAALADEYDCMIVCPDGGYTTLYFDNPLDANYRFESHFIQYLMPYIESHYPVLAQRQYRSITGNSMGGFGGFFMASRHPDLFASAGSMSGVLDLNPFSKSSPLSQKTTDTTCCVVNWDALDKATHPADTTVSPLRLIMDCGVDDYLLQVNRNVHRKLTDRKIPHDYTERPGRHEWPYWKNAILYQLLFFRQSWNQPGTTATVKTQQNHPLP